MNREVDLEKVEIPFGPARNRGLRMTILPGQLRVRFAAREREVQQIADADGKRNEAEGRGDPRVGLMGNAGDHAEGGHEADGTADEKNGVLAGTRRRSN